MLSDFDKDFHSGHVSLTDALVRFVKGKAETGSKTTLVNVVREALGLMREHEAVRCGKLERLMTVLAKAKPSCFRHERSCPTQNASAGSAIRLSAPAVAFASSEEVSGSMRSMKKRAVITLAS